MLSLKASSATSYILRAASHRLVAPSSASAARPFSTFYSRPLLTHLLSSTPALIKPIPSDTFSPLFDTAESFIEKHGHLDKTLDAEEPIFNPDTNGVTMSPTTHTVVSEFIESGEFSRVRRVTRACTTCVWPLCEHVCMSCVCRVHAPFVHTYI